MRLFRPVIPTLLSMAGRISEEKRDARQLRTGVVGHVTSELGAMPYRSAPGRWRMGLANEEMVVSQSIPAELLTDVTVLSSIKWHCISSWMSSRSVEYCRCMDALSAASADARCVETPPKQTVKFRFRQASIASAQSKPSRPIPVSSIRKQSSGLPPASRYACRNPALEMCGVRRWFTHRRAESGSAGERT